ncbi:hypothetical protein DPX39_090077700 [Trypanosoma brucei equiperdum]|uniref:Uncharacterized protein n=1 Tax=Trypanosoma brucei equiperdum TaxID=630700 RepID=A0A3L6L3R0_9TRYP|nr:hypothetical protein DPX39_090077700 [Trypanosoma brucei equiperdum]
MKLFTPEETKRDESRQRDHASPAEGSGSNVTVVSGVCSAERSVIRDAEQAFKDVVTNSLEEILRLRPREPMRLLVDNLLKSSSTHEIERHEISVGDGTNCVLSKACTRKNGADSLCVGGLPLLRLIAPNSFEVDAAVRCLSETIDPDAKLIVFIEQPNPSVDLFFVGGIPYFANLTEQLMARRRDGNPDTVLDSAVGTDKIIAHIGEALRLGTKTIKETIGSLAASMQRCSFIELPRLQRNFFEMFHVVDAALHSRKHDHLFPHSVTSVPGVLLVSYNPSTAPMTFTRVIATVLPLYEEVQRLKVAETLLANKTRIQKLDFHYVTEYWRGVLQRRDSRDKTRGESVTVSQRAPKKASGRNPKGNPPKPKTLPVEQLLRVQRRESEDAAFLRVVQHLQSNAVVRIQALYRGHRWRKRLGSALSDKLRTRAQTSSEAQWVEDLPLSTPPLLRQCVEKVSAAHGELFGNYVISCPPMPRIVKILKPTSRAIKVRKEDGTEDVDSEEETWEEEHIVVPVNRQTKPPPHFNLLRRLMECEYAGRCNTVKYAANIQQDCAGLSTLQRRAYDCYKSLVLNLLHIAYLELYRRGRIPLTVRNFEEYVNRWHSEIFSWFSAPHIFSRIALRKAMKPPYPVPVICTKETLEKERVLIVRAYGRGGIYHGPSSEKGAVKECKESLTEEERDEEQEEFLQTLPPLPPLDSGVDNEHYISGVYAAPVLLSQRWWEATLKRLTSSNREAKVAWWTLYDNPAVYINGQPISLVPRHELQEVEGRPSFDELVPCIEVARKAPCNSTSSKECSNCDPISPARCRRFTLRCAGGETVSPEPTSDHRVQEGKTTPGASGAVDAATDTDGESSVSTFGVSLESEDSHLVHELQQNFLDDQTETYPQYCTVGPLCQYSIPAPVHGLQPLIIAPPIPSVHCSEHGYQCREDRNTSSTGINSACYFPSDHAVSHGSKTAFNHQNSVTLEWDDFSVASQRKPSVGQPSRTTAKKSSAFGEGANVHNVATVSAMATHVGQRIMHEGRFLHERPWLTPVCIRSRGPSFSDFMIKCLHQMRNGYKIVVAVDEPYQIMLFNAVCLLKMAAKEEEDLERTLAPGTPLQEESVVPTLAPHELLSSETAACLSLLQPFYDELSKSVDNTVVSVEGCAIMVQKVMKRMSPGGLLFLDQIPMLMEQAEREKNQRLLGESIIAVVQRIELFCWLVIFEAFLASAIRSQSNGMKIDEILPKFHTYVNASNVVHWIDCIDPWKDVPHRSPDPFHLRYSNGLRRWDNPSFIFRGATVL